MATAILVNRLTRTTLVVVLVVIAVELLLVDRKIDDEFVTALRLRVLFSAELAATYVDVEAAEAFDIAKVDYCLINSALNTGESKTM